MINWILRISTEIFKIKIIGKYILDIVSSCSLRVLFPEILPGDSPKNRLQLVGFNFIGL